MSPPAPCPPAGISGSMQTPRRQRRQHPLDYPIQSGRHRWQCLGAGEKVPRRIQSPPRARKQAEVFHSRPPLLGVCPLPSPADLVQVSEALVLAEPSWKIGRGRTAGREQAWLPSEVFEWGRLESRQQVIDHTQNAGNLLEKDVQ